jgi:hypothetical protein
LNSLKIVSSGGFLHYRLQVAVFWVMIPCNDLVGYHRFGGPCCLHLQGEVVGQAGSKTLSFSQPVIYLVKSLTH